MIKYKIYFERRDMNAIEVVILGSGSNCYVNSIKVCYENFSFNFKNTEENIIKAVIARLNKYEIKNIERIN